MWALCAWEAACLCQVKASAEYLLEADRHNEAFNDHTNLISCLETQATLLEMRGRPELALPALLRVSALRAAAAEGTVADASSWDRVAGSVARLYSQIPGMA
ncbi:unnamed protein product, partial [Discosporangium mesarthrocarpum]